MIIYLPEAYIAFEPDLQSFIIGAEFMYFSGLLSAITSYKNYLEFMICVELMYFGLISAFVIFSQYIESTEGAVYGLLLIVVVACESAVGLGMLILVYRFGRSIEFSAYDELHGL